MAAELPTRASVLAVPSAPTCWPAWLLVKIQVLDQLSPFPRTFFRPPYLRQPGSPSPDHTALFHLLHGAHRSLNFFFFSFCFLKPFSHSDVNSRRARIPFVWFIDVPVTPGSEQVLSDQSRTHTPTHSHRAVATYVTLDRYREMTGRTHSTSHHARRSCSTGAPCPGLSCSSVTGAVIAP